MRKYLLTDFNLPRWKKVDMYLINSEINRLNSMSHDLIGEYRHPYNNDITVINFENVSHRIKNLIIEDKRVYGDVEFLDTPHGRPILNLGIDYLYDIQFSIRALGTNNTLINNIITWDLR